MSFFYLNPVKGELPAHLLETIILKRIEYLKAIVKHESKNFNEFVMEGSLYDNVGHFMLCITAVLCDNREFSNFVVKAETCLFKQRLTALSSYELRYFVKKLLQSIKKHDVKNNKETLYRICQNLMIKHISQHTCSNNHDEYCSAYNITVNFKHCLSLVAKREVEMKNGIAAVPCGRWKQLLILKFYEEVLRKVTKVNLNTLKHDPRISDIVGKIKKHFCAEVNDSVLSVLAKDVDNLSKLFPPCMLNLHNNLRKHHRLSHDQRFIFSLFLKDIGMLVDEAIDFWRNEYRQLANNTACCHNWEKDEKKYLYGIRHMYGLEGARKNYTSVSCQRIQSNVNVKEGGCPFKTFDTVNLVNLLNTESLKSQDILVKINEFQGKHLYTAACMFHLQQTFCGNSAICDINGYNFSPVKHYKIAENANKL